MSTKTRLVREILELSARVANVTSAEIEGVVSQLIVMGFDVKSKTNAHGTWFQIGEVGFGICSHHKGSKQLKPCYVRGFLKTMASLGLLEE